MTFNPVSLQEKLVATGLPHHSLPFIHGALTAQVVSTLPLLMDDYPDNDDAREDAETYTLIFAIEDGQVPKPGPRDERIWDVLAYLGRVKHGLEENLEYRDFTPYFGGHPEGADGMEIAREWCDGFLSGASLMMGNWEGKKLVEEDFKERFCKHIVPFGYCSNPGDYNLPEDVKTDLHGLFRDPAKAVPAFVYSMDEFLRQWEEEHHEEEEDGDTGGYSDTSGLPFIRLEPKTGRNDPCPCGSGRKYKKCCGCN
jgi:hypothetical protein